MGFERLMRAIQGKNSNYDTDIFQPIIKVLGDITGHTYGQNEKTDIAMRVIADHLRAIAFSIADGQLPGNAKAGYVIRRILRRAVRYGYTFLGQKQAFIYQLVPVLIQEMGEAFPELPAQRDLIMKVMQEEEDSFLRTLENGIRLLNGVMDETRAEGKTEIAGDKAFTLFDTFGFPLDLTQLICRENGLSVDEKGFDEEMAKQKARARNAAQVQLGDWNIVREGESQFVGYDHTEYSCHILKYREVKQKKGVVYEVVLDTTPFYAEMGGEIGDTGVLVNESETISVLDTKKENNLSIHIVDKLPADATAEFMACVDVERRRAIEANHSCTHLIDEALRQVLGTHVEQKGSLVTEHSLRFDFSHFEKVTPEQIREVEHLINEKIRQNIPLTEYRDCPVEEAKKMGAIALFGEKYGDKVRVVQFGSSVEFCGGCHVQSTGQIGMMRIISESSIAAGVRRIEAITGKALDEYLDRLQDTFADLRALFNNAPDLITSIKRSVDENAELKKAVEDFRAQKAQQLKQDVIARAQDVNGVKVVAAVLPIDAQSAKDIAFQLRAQFTENLLVVIGAAADAKPSLTVAFSDNLVAAGKNAGTIIREAAKLIQGGGGGQAHFATAGGKNVDALQDAVNKVVALAEL
jgi:alanyl-tRNA synthetase